MPTFSLIYTSVRSQRIGPVIQDWVSKARRKDDIEVILALDGPDEKSQAVLNDPATFAGLTVDFITAIQPDPPFNCVRGWNLAASKAKGKVLVQVTDDMIPPDAWDVKLKALEPANWMEEDWAVHVEDGYVHNLMVLAIITKVRYDRFGYFFYPEYQSLFCDTELTEVAYREKRVIEAKHLLFDHQHPDCQKRERDAVDLVHASKERWLLGEKLFNFRKQRNFPIDAGPNAKDAPETAPGLSFCVYVQATRDDLCLFEVCQRMIEEGVRDFFFSVPDEYWSGRPTPTEHIDQVKEVARQVAQIGGHVQIMLHKVKSYRWPGDTRLRVETRVRNDALSAVREAGFEHVLIVDGDELWKRGTLKFVEALIEKFHPTSINCLMVPVVGFPGYPIDGATDVAVIYVNSATPFKECRTPIGEQFRIQMPLVIHFTGTRRSMEETIQKHKDSGHYDDPEYDFEGWLRDTLPNIKPGLKNVHMFKRYQIWPAVRNWLAEEVKEIPPSVWPYLAIESSCSSAGK